LEDQISERVRDRHGELTGLIFQVYCKQEEMQQLGLEMEKKQKELLEL